MAHLEDCRKPIVDDISINVIASHLNYCGPVCPIRRIYADALFDFGIIFLIFHEFSHHINGHLRFKQASKREKTTVLPIELQTLEIEADCLATKLALLAIEKDIDNPNPLGTIESYGFVRAVGNLHNRQEVLLLAIFSTFRIFKDEWRKSVTDSKVHPHFFLRITSITEIVLKHSADEFVGNQQRVDEIILNYQKISEAIINITNVEQELDMSFFFPNALEVHREMLADAWYSVAPKLFKFRRNSRVSRWSVVPDWMWREFSHRAPMVYYKYCTYKFNIFNNLIEQEWKKIYRYNYPNKLIY